jgi:DNA polymerase III epsilon subunit-like protein
MSSSPVVATTPVSTSPTVALPLDTNNIACSNPSKDQRRRFKKLRKRAERFCPQTDQSGIVQAEEWQEIKQQQQQQQQQQLQLLPTTDDATFAPWIGIRQSCKKLKDKAVRDGVHHRFALKYLLTKQYSATTNNNNKKSKRPREDSSSVIPSWMTFHNPACVDHVAVLELHVPGGASQLQVQDVEDMMNPLNNKEDGFPTRWFEGPRLQSISDVLLYEKPPQPAKNKAKTDRGSSSSRAQELMEVLQSLTLTRDKLQEEGYPLPEGEKHKNAPSNTSTAIDASSMSRNDVFRTPTSFSLQEARAIVKSKQVAVAGEKFPFVMLDADTKFSGDGPEKSSPPTRVFGLDCEMVNTQHGKELGRVTLIEYNTSDDTSVDSKPFQECYQVRMDDFVVPYAPILDYVTAYSGITARSLENVTTRLEQVQAALVTYIRPNDIVVGHSLENDLMATRWIHCSVIDTAILFRTNASFKHSLKHISLNLLKKKIQGGDHHCSEEDAAAALELVIRRAQQGPNFALRPKDKKWWIPVQTKQNEPATVFIGPSQWLKDHVLDHPNAIHALTCEDMDFPNTKAINAWLTGPKRRAGLVWANLTIATAGQLKNFQHLLVRTVLELDVVAFCGVRHLLLITDSLPPAYY